MSKYKHNPNSFRLERKPPIIDRIGYKINEITSEMTMPFAKDHNRRGDRSEKLPWLTKRIAGAAAAAILVIGIPASAGAAVGKVAYDEAMKYGQGENKKIGAIIDGVAIGFITGGATLAAEASAAHLITGDVDDIPSDFATWLTDPNNPFKK